MRKYFKWHGKEYRLHRTSPAKLLKKQTSKHNKLTDRKNLVFRFANLLRKMPSFQQKIMGNTRNKKVWRIYREGAGEAVKGNNPWRSPKFGLKKNENYPSQTGELRHFQMNKNRDFVASRPALKEILRSPSGRNTRTPNSNSNPHEEVTASG